jgi:hypothetical protein
MEIKNKRENPRFDSLNLLSYSLYDATDTLIGQGMGRTLNVSLSGILIETHIAIDIENRMVIAIGFADKLLEIEGKPIYQRKNEKNMFETGVSFFHVSQEQRSALSEFVDAFEAENPQSEE